MSALALAGFPMAVTAQQAGRIAHVADTTVDSATARSLAPVRVTARRDDLIGVARTASEGRIEATVLRVRPLAREGEVLEAVPGVIVTQHSGEGKANQYFIRGFNLDHGTDFQTRVEGMPVNLPTHGHGQGYTDLNFITPELLEHIDYRLGVYHAELGDFGSAGAAEFHFRRTLDEPFVATEGGQHGLARVAAGASWQMKGGEMLVGGEAKAYDGPWLRPQRLRKMNALARFTAVRGTSSFSLLALAYRNGWNATDQIPARAVEAGLLDRFGQVDSTNGGTAERYSLSATWRRTSGLSHREIELFAIRSNLRLFSNFTYFLDDPDRGDQFSQLDQRTVVGGNVTHDAQLEAHGVPHRWQAGLQARADIIGGLGLFRTERQVRFATVREDRVFQTGTGLFLSVESQWAQRLRSVVGVRGDMHTFDVRSDLRANSGRRAAAIASPKASVVFTPSPRAELYVSGGFGYHSNDARGTTITVDPVSRGRADRVDPLVRSRGGELGLRVAPARPLRLTASAWVLNLDSELLFIGDAGSTEASPASMRRGMTVTAAYQPVTALAVDTDVSFARARFDGNRSNTVRVPGAIERVVAGGITWSPAPQGLFAATRVRHFGGYPLVPDNSVRAPAATLVNASAGYQLPSGIRFEATILNVANAHADDIQYHYASRLKGEPAAGVEAVHSHPVEPRQIRIGLERHF